MAMSQAMPEWIERLLEKLARLREADTEFLVHGASTHWYRFGPRLTATWAAWLEAQYGITLPDQYRQFVTAVGNGGAGPGLGLQRFGYLDSRHQVPVAIGTGVMHETVYPSGFRRTVEQQYTPDGTPTDGLEVSFYDSMAALAGGSPILAESFPFTGRKCTGEEMRDILGETFFKRAEPWRWHVPGALSLSADGCGVIEMLILNGPWAGAVWVADPANDGGMDLVADSFELWYDRWLDSGLQYCARSLNYRRQLSMFCTHHPEEARAVETLLRARGITCEVDSAFTPNVVVLVKKDQAEAARPLIEGFEARRTKRCT